ncbi:NAD(P)H-hydrate dehydratase [Hydrogenophaga sp. 5NK40-0174]|uniref:NAD(P)H-hydrate dehydratase n=1 Tax=Hydrogenophaga sp. 5NK40-0174 TaxID=3127649 RepID=UPI0031032EF0
MTSDTDSRPSARLLDVFAGGTPLPLHDVAASRAWEAASAKVLPPHTLMARAGLAIARVALAVCPHARHIWVACGPGNNGGDGFVAATHLHQWSRSKGLGQQITVSLHGREETLPEDARWALTQMREAGLDLSPPPSAGGWDMCIDALLGIGGNRIPAGDLLAPWEALRKSAKPVIQVDIPSGLLADSGAWPPGDIPLTPPGAERHTLCLLSLKPGVFTASGRDAAGRVWYDDLGTQPPASLAPTAWLCGQGSALRPDRPHASHKGSFGDVLVAGGQRPSADKAGMAGAAMLAARAALHAGAGRVYVCSIGGDTSPGEISWDPACPELMFRRVEQCLADPQQLASPRTAVVCGCGGGHSIRQHLPALLSRTARLVLDADALNAIADDPGLQALLSQRRDRPDRLTVLTPHPLEAARLLGMGIADIQENRLTRATELSQRYGALVVLKGSGSIVAAPGEAPWINRSGNARLATAGTGDVLAGMIGAALAACELAEDMPSLVRDAVWRHGHLADTWPDHGARLTAGALAVLAG